MSFATDKTWLATICSWIPMTITCLNEMMLNGKEVKMTAFCVLCFAAPKYFLSSQLNGGRQADRQTIYWVVQEYNFVEESKSKSNAPKQQSVFIETRITFFAADNCVARKQFRYLSFDCQIRVKSSSISDNFDWIESVHQKDGNQNWENDLMKTRILQFLKWKYDYHASVMENSGL